MSEQKLHQFSRRFSISQQYGPVGWVVLAVIVALGSALIAVTASSANIARASVHQDVTRLDSGACTHHSTRPERRGAPHWKPI